jgi:hypothetical protein
VPRYRRLPALLIRLLALSIACILAGQAFFSSYQICELRRAQAIACCAGNDGQSEADEASADDDSAASIADEQGDADDCQCPAGCALGCCSPARAIVARVASTERIFGLGIELPVIEPVPARPSPEMPGILHVPKRAS